MTSYKGAPRSLLVAFVVTAIGLGFAWLAGSGGIEAFGYPVFFVCAVLAFLVNWLAFVPAALAQKLMGSAQIFVGLMEDLPYRENRVGADGAVHYTLHDELKARRQAFRKAIRHAFRGQRRMFLGFAPDLNWGHPCGTLRFGTDPASSVLRPDGRAHDVDNLWVADASFMPTSMGVNPSLTIAAFALHVAKCRR